MGLLKTIDNIFGTNFYGTSQANKFDKWANSEKNYEKATSGKDVDEFKMFDFNASTYSTDLEDFAQNYINKYDENDDGVLDIDEFTNMASGGEEIPKEYGEDFDKLYTDLFNSLNLDDDEESITAAEFATMLYVSDMDWENFSETDGDVASSLDGNLDYINYQTYSSLLPSEDEEENEQYEALQYQRQMFYDNYYA
ncbi:MAG: hypothetical protein LUH05_06420 [Candidatus Gastranaerophilales bacterium]|nr:hypothetical protein [Candidatus Gastranaerophilales bacterium]